ncbi:3-isopropylmalate dehydratase small subunit [Sphingomonas sp. SRS2]|uniref:3-isopropylmalate dehydratase small subunit n=1 Tax=Sphingomonas sp. SRS2 TaxID=133190 RepID=UPI00061848FA|nr:3-isopropylmalate dehydratase small subunit [Sphingomonas sp. SRS2]KKC24031.1 3-isopropylmalate dehydratase [Sphingomonas sp. SRS2]
MKAIRTVSGVAIPFGRKNVDTDVILPAKHLKVITRTGLGRYAFTTVREGQPDNIFDNPRNSGAPILIAGDNFGCGSSREHAPWALADMGIRAIIAPSFADIFSGNAFKNAMLLIELPQEQVDRLLQIAGDIDITIDLERQVVISPLDDCFDFSYDPFRKASLLEGLDEIGLTERNMAAIDAFARQRIADFPWIAGAASRAA